MSITIEFTIHNHENYNVQLDLYHICSTLACILFANHLTSMAKYWTIFVLNWFMRSNNFALYFCVQQLCSVFKFIGKRKM